MIDSLDLSEILEGKGRLEHSDCPFAPTAKIATNTIMGMSACEIMILILLVDLYGIIIILILSKKILYSNMYKYQQKGFGLERINEKYI